MLYDKVLTSKVDFYSTIRESGKQFDEKHYY